MKDLIFGDIRASNIILSPPSSVPVFIDFSFGDIISQDPFKEQQRRAVYGIFKNWPDFGGEVAAWGKGETSTSSLSKEHAPDFNPPPSTKTNM